MWFVGLVGFSVCWFILLAGVCASVFGLAFDCLLCLCLGFRFYFVFDVLGCLQMLFVLFWGGCWLPCCFGGLGLLLICL